MLRHLGLRARPGLRALQRPLSDSSSPAQHRDDVLNRVEIVTDPDRSAEICRHYAQQCDALAMDMEGNTLPKLGLLQVKDRSGQIKLFRTGIEPRLWNEGGLKALMENIGITKVFHGAATDLRAAVNQRVWIWGVYDTDKAHHVVQYQSHVSCRFL